MTFEYELFHWLQGPKSIANRFTTIVNEYIYDPLELIEMRKNYDIICFDD